MTPGASRFKTVLRQPEWLAAIVIGAAVFWLHFYFFAHAGGVWRDEVNSLNVAGKHSLADMAKDSFPVLMPLLTHGWLALGLGKSDVALRTLGLLIGLGLPTALWLAAWKIRRGPPLLGLTLFALNSTLIVFGDSLRAYGLGSLLMIVTTAGACVFLEKPSWTRAAWLAIFSVLSVQTLYHNAVLVGAVCAGAMAVCARQKNWRGVAQVFLAGAAAAISLLPYVPRLLSGREASAVLRTGLDPVRFKAQFTDSLGFPLGQYVYVWAALALMMVIYAVLVLRRKVKTPVAIDENVVADLRVFAGVTVLAALAGFCGFLWCAALPSQSWYLLPVMAVAATCFDAAWPVLQRPWRPAFLGFVLATALIAIPVDRQDLNYRFTNIDIHSRQLTAVVSPQDYVVVVPWFCGLTFDHYFKAATPWDTLPPLADHATHRYDLVKLQLQNTNAIAPVLARIAATLQAGHRVWILATMGWMDVPEAGTVAPASLPPAPLEISGWSETPYAMVWSSQVGHFLGDHGVVFGRTENPTAGMRIAEDTELFMANGWKTNSP
jgi:hypothetical protein